MVGILILYSNKQYFDISGIVITKDNRNVSKSGCVRYVHLQVKTMESLSLISDWLTFYVIAVSFVSQFAEKSMLPPQLKKKKT